jgi:hypothetical protein
MVLIFVDFYLNDTGGVILTPVGSALVSQSFLGTHQCCQNCLKVLSNGT